MIPVVYSINDAMRWFLENHTGFVMCEKPDGTERLCSSFQEAAAFYNEKNEDEKENKNNGLI